MNALRWNNIHRCYTLKDLQAVVRSNFLLLTKIFFVIFSSFFLITFHHPSDQGAQDQWYMCCRLRTTAFKCLPGQRLKVKLGFKPWLLLFFLLSSLSPGSWEN